jgi:hypothetical protein
MQPSGDGEFDEIPAERASGSGHEQCLPWLQVDQVECLHCGHPVEREGRGRNGIQRGGRMCDRGLVQLALDDLGLSGVMAPKIPRSSGDQADSLLPVLRAIKDWAEANMLEVRQAREIFETATA